MFWIFLTLAIAGFVLLAGSFFFGHDHDHDHDFSHDMDHGHDHGGDGHAGTESTISIFSTKIFFTFIMCFGATGAICMHSGVGTTGSLLISLGSGIVCGLIMLAMLRLLYSQQASSDINFSSARGKNGTVITGISENEFGAISVYSEGRQFEVAAKGVDGKEFSRGTIVKIVGMHGNQAIVDVIDPPNS